MYKTRSPSQIPVAVFSRAEVEKYQKYANFAIKAEVVDSDPWSNTPPPKPRKTDIFSRVGYGITDRTERQYEQAKQSLNERVAKQPWLRNNPNEFKQTGRLYARLQAFKKDPSLVGKLAVGGVALGALGVAGAGVGGAMFLRRRRTKKGKVVLEQVRRKQG